MTAPGTSLALLIGLGPSALLLAGLAPERLWRGDARRLADVASAVAAAVCVGSLGALAWTLGHAALRTRLVGPAWLGLGLYVDALGAAMLALVGLVGAVVLRYSRAYLGGDPRQAGFLRALSLTLAAVLTMAAAGGLAAAGLAWFATGVGLRRLLAFNAARQAAVLAARKNLLVSRLADVLLIAAAALLLRAAGSLAYPDLLAAAGVWRGVGGAPAGAQAAAALIAGAALLKSAQLPLHGWLLEVMETPTPVSALLHAGIINGGGFLLLRLAFLLDQAPGAQALLATVGAATAVFGSLVMLPQTSVKVALACSTVAQIGFMMLELGLGAYGVALLHLVAHSLYKAHAFLSSGSVVEIARTAWSPQPGERPHPARLAVALAAALAVVLAVGRALGVDLAHAPGAMVLGAVLVLGLTQLLAQAMDARPDVFVLARVLGLAALLSVAYFGLHGAGERLFAAAPPVYAAAAQPWRIGLAAGLIAAFAGLTAFQVAVVGRVDGPRWRALHAHVANGFYLNTLANRALLRLWPDPPGPGASGGAPTRARG